MNLKSFGYGYVIYNPKKKAYMSGSEIKNGRKVPTYNPNLAASVVWITKRGAELARWHRYEEVIPAKLNEYDVAVSIYSAENLEGNHGNRTNRVQ